MLTSEVSTSKLSNRPTPAKPVPTQLVGMSTRKIDMGTCFCRKLYWDCDWQNDVDHVAGMNIKLRIDDHQISRSTPYGTVKKTLDERFLRRIKSRNATAHGGTLSKPRQTKLDVGGARPFQSCQTSRSAWYFIIQLAFVFSLMINMLNARSLSSELISCSRR